MHTECMRQFEEEMNFIDRIRSAGTTTVILSNGRSETRQNTIDCPHCKMPIEETDEIWAAFDDVMHERCKEEHLAMSELEPEQVPKHGWLRRAVTALADIVFTG